MPRPAGVRNHDFALKRADLVARLTDHALATDLRRPSLRQFAQACEAVEPTLRHYFGDRSGLILAILEEIGERAKPFWTLAGEPAANLDEAIAGYYRLSAAGMIHGGFVRAHAFGLIEGLADREAGAAYLRFVLEPSLAALERRLALTPGRLQGADRVRLRAAALSILTPLLGLSLHQDLLGGAQSDPLDMGAILSALQGLTGAALSAEAPVTP